MKLIMSNVGYAIDKFIQLLFGINLLEQHKIFSLQMKIDCFLLKKFNHFNNQIKIFKLLMRMMSTLIYMASLQIGNLKKCMKLKNFVKNQIKINPIFLSNVKIKD